MKKLNHNRVLNIVAALLVAVSLMCGNVVQIRAYTADTALTGYPFIIDNMEVLLRNSAGVINAISGTAKEQNSYIYINSNIYNDLVYLAFGNIGAQFIFPYEPELYDYYVVGNVAGSLNDVFDFFGVEVHGGTTIERCTDVNFYDFNGANIRGKSFSAKIPELSNANICAMFLNANTNTVVNGDIWFCASIVPVAKGTEVEQLNQAILNELVKINQNLITANTLQQQTIDAIKDHDTNVGNWFTTLTSNLGNWFQNLYTSMGVGFEKLYQQMTKEQDEQLHGYQDTITSEAANAFSSESDKLTALEGDLSNQSNQYVSDFTAQGFDLGILATIGSSMVFVTTWFTNFWNMGGIFTAGLNFCFALTIVFFIFRFKR